MISLENIALFFIIFVLMIIYSGTAHNVRIKALNLRVYNLKLYFKTKVS